MRRLILLLALLAIVSALPVDANYMPETADPCALCAQFPVWCFRCMMIQWWDLGCVPGDYDCIGW
jgi:hypothetical protein